MGVGALASSGGLPATSNEFSFGSKHNGVAYFCFADGSVHGLCKGGDYSTFLAATGWHDGQMVNFEALTD
jgi:prepilin-type processing-associated H-X9-DG protein